MMALEPPEPIAIEDYLAGEMASQVKHEYIGGTVHAMAGGTNRHNTIALNASASLLFHLRGKPCQSFNSDTKVRIEFPSHTRFYYPDAMVVCTPNPDADRFQDQPVVVVEVLSESTRRADLEEKSEAYLTLSSLKVLLLVETGRPEVLAYRRKSEGGFAMERWTRTDLVIPLPEIGTELSFEELYARINFEEH